MRKIALTLALAGASLGVWAQGGYQDGVDYYNADRFEEAKIILDKTLHESNTDKGLANYYLGAIALREGDQAAARRFFEAGIAANPNCGLNHVGLGELALMGGDRKQAEEQFSTALKPNKKSPEVNAAIARAYFNVDPVAYAKQIDKYIQAADKGGNNKAAVVYILRGDMAKNTNVGEAAGWYEGAMVYSEEGGRVNPEAYVKYANLYNKVDPQFAIRKLTELKEKVPTSALAQSELAEKYYDAELFGKAAAAYREYMANPNHFQKDEQRYSQLLFFDGKNQESLDLAKNVLAQDPGNVYMWRMVMLNDAALGNLDEAAQYGQKLFGQKKVAVTTNDYNTYGDILEKLGRPDEAVAIYTQAYQADPVKNREMLATLSSLYTDMEKYAEAAEAQQKYVDGGDVKLNDYFVLARRYSNLAISQPEGSEGRADAAQKGIAVVDQTIAKAVDPMPLYNLKARLIQVRDQGKGKVSPDLAETCLLMVETLNQDPENLSKQTGAYRNAYANLNTYYTEQGDKDKAEYYKSLFTQLPD